MTNAVTNTDSGVRDLDIAITFRCWAPLHSALLSLGPKKRKAAGAGSLCADGLRVFRSAQLGSWLNQLALTA